ncbi:MAG: hypothetical protein K9I25_06125, partial [Crocinitomicaceae bacterium]|nr:hypothetical protein [Crocinitomicaceae bacterium]
MRLRLLLLVFLALTIQPNISFAQAYCNNPLGAIAPNMTWQYFYHTCRGYVTFQAQAGCTYQFTYCSSYAPSANYNGDPYLTISTQPTSGNLTQNDDFCGLGSYLNWTAPSTGTFYLNLGNCCSSGCGCGFNRNLAYRSTNCAGGVTSPTSITASAATICAGQSVTLTANGAMGTTYWYTGSCGGAQIGTGATLTVTPNVTTTYFVNNNSGGQFSPNCATITITVNPSPPAPTATGNTSLCGPGTTTLTASGGNSYIWYANSNGTGQLGTSPSYTTPVISTTTTYYVQASGNVVAPGSQTFNFTGSQQTWTVPNGVTSINFTIAGAKGGNGTSGIAGANGATLAGALAVTPGQTIFINVGGQGAINAGGFNGGGNGGSGAGGGGGATDIRLGGNGLGNRAVVAAGGGGAGRGPSYSPTPGAGGTGTFCGSPWGYGGSNGGGCSAGTSGGCAGGTAPSYGTGGAGGGLSSGGGTAGSGGGVLGQAGSLGQGGNGGTSVYGAGGGGGGFYGGSAGMSGSGGCHGGGGGG